MLAVPLLGAARGERAMKRLGPLLVVCAVVACALRASSQTAQPLLKDEYHSVEVGKFEVSPGVDFSAERLAALQDAIVKQLQDSKKLQEVLHAGDPPAHANAPRLRLVGTVTRFKPGNQAERYFVGFGAGSTELYADVALTDASTGRTMATEEIRGLVTAGLFGGQSSYALQDFARRVATATRLMMEKAEPAPGAPASPAPEPAAGPAEEYLLELKPGDMKKSQEEINFEASSGYRVKGAEVTGRKNAALRFEKLAAPSEIYQYQLLHARTPGAMKKQLNEAGSDGFRLVPSTLMPDFAGVLSWVMEKPQGNQTPRYDYRVHETLRVSSAEHNLEKDRKQGYDFVGTAEIIGGHIVIAEKAVPTNASK
jgi:Domain of unknown function (DUF4410)